MNSKADYVYVGNEEDELSQGKILFIYLISDNNKIVEIKIVTQKVLAIYYILELAYGKPTQKYGDKLIWRTNNIECSIEGENNDIQGYHILYREISTTRKQMNNHREKNIIKAQNEL